VLTIAKDNPEEIRDVNYGIDLMDIWGLAIVQTVVRPIIGDVGGRGFGAAAAGGSVTPVDYVAPIKVMFAEVGVTLHVTNLSARRSLEDVVRPRTWDVLVAGP
jgi:hypothetical protein